jgi:flagellar basal-body rod protein FlgG
MLVQETNLDVVTNNLANVDTVGYRRRISANSEFSALMDRIEKVSEDGETKIVTAPPFTMNWKGKQIIGPLGLAAVYSETCMDTQPGVMRVTDNPLDVAIDGPGFFSVQDAEGNTYYTRQGNFLLNAGGELITFDGMTVQGGGGPIALGEASNAFIANNGQVFADGEVVGEIALYTFENPSYLRQAGRNNLAATDDSGAATEVENPRLLPGAIEMANVSVVEEMVRMMEAQRAYEGASKALMTHDEETGKLISSYGRV